MGGSDWRERRGRAFPDDLPAGSTQNFLPWSALGAILMLEFLAMVFAGVLIARPPRGPEATKLWIIALSVMSLFALLFGYTALFKVVVSSKGVWRRAGPPFRGKRILWSELARVEFYFQQRRRGLGSGPARWGIRTQRLRGFRFWSVSGVSIDVSEFVGRPPEIRFLWGLLIDELARRAAGAGVSARARIRHGHAQQENHFQGTLARYSLGIISAAYLGRELVLTKADGQVERVGLEEDAEADLVVVELDWSREVPKDGAR